MANSIKKANTEFIENFTRVTLKNRSNHYCLGILNIKTGVLTVFENNDNIVYTKAEVAELFNIEKYSWNFA